MISHIPCIRLFILVINLVKLVLLTVILSIFFLFTVIILAMHTFFITIIYIYIFVLIVYFKGIENGNYLFWEMTQELKKERVFFHLYSPTVIISQRYHFN